MKLLRFNEKFFLNDFHTLYTEYILRSMSVI